jgi:hypothetical protein
MLTVPFRGGNRLIWWILSRPACFEATLHSSERQLPGCIAALLLCGATMAIASTYPGSAGRPGPLTAPRNTPTLAVVSSVLTFSDRPSDSPFVDRIWRSRSERGGTFVSIAQSHFEIAVTRLRGRTFVTLRGPETTATMAACPAEGEWLGIRFKLGTFMPGLMPAQLSDRRDVTLSDATTRAFWLNGSAWEYPDFENADTFVTRLARQGIIARDFAVGAMLDGEHAKWPIRSAQRHFVRSTGITHRTLRQIERARYATTLLKQGVSILDSVDAAGYFDQPHLTRSLRTLIGATPAQISRGTHQLSFLYKTKPLPALYDAHGRFIHDRIEFNDSLD